MSDKPQVPEQRNVYIGINNAECDFDMYLYELLGFGFLERDIGSEKFWRYYTSSPRTPDDIETYIRNLILLRDSCDRVIKKLQLADTIHTIEIS